MADPVAVVVKGPDPTLRSRAIDDAVERLLEHDDRTLALSEAVLPAARGSGEEESGSEARLAVIAAALEGVRTPPFGSRRRVVVLRTDEAYSASDAELIATYLLDPEPTTVVVVELPGRVPTVLSKALGSAAVEEVRVGAAREATSEVLSEHAARVGIRLEPEAARLVTERLGQDAGRVPAIVELLASTYGSGTTLGVEDVEPHLGEQGAVPAFQLTKAIDAGDVPGAINVLHRMTGSMNMHPLQVMAVLHGHFRRIMALDDTGISGESAAVEALGGGVNSYVAKLALERARHLGSDGIRRAFDLLAKADVDLRGRTAAPDQAVLEVLVTRLATLSRPRRGTRTVPREQRG